MLVQALEVLNRGGRLAVITYHSLEDRIVKNFMRTGNFSGEVTKDFFGHPISPFITITRKAIIPGEDEVAWNNRARSAKLRIAEKK
jgi:16S rRNA (cytosine1402-N4)-methyltransferase